MNQDSTTYRVVFQLSSNDTFVQKALLRQLNNLLKAMEDVQVEVVTHSYGIDMVLKESPFRESIEDLKKRGVRFLVCENTLKADEVDVSELMGMTSVVPAGVAHIIRRQTEGWAYIKAGY